MSTQLACVTGSRRTMTALSVNRQVVLSTREVAVLVSWIRHDTKQHACRDLFISIGTLNTHLARIRAKYESAGRAASTKAALVARALQDGLISLDDL